MRWFILLCAAAFLDNAYCKIFVWQLHGVVRDLTVGPDNAVHCRLVSPTGFRLYDDFGPCRVSIDRVAEEHNGIWTMHVIQPNNILAVQQTFSAQVTTAGPKPAVSTKVQQEKPLVELTCSVFSSDTVTACVFRDPSGQVLQARPGVTEDRYSFVESSLPGVQSCGIEINGPITSDLGLWRCDIQTEADTYYGHLSVLCPWAMQVPDIAESVVSNATLTSQTNDQVVSEGDSVVMSCSVQSAIRYCYFRAQNGTIFNVRPETTSYNFDYVGAGLDSGECGVRFSRLLASDSGRWSCHVGFPDSSEPEQRVQFTIDVQELITATQYPEDGELVVQGVVNRHSMLDYCRFVRIDGQGFTSENVPAGYTDKSSFSQNLCKIRVSSPTMLDHHPWTVVAKVIGEEDEFAQSTLHTIEMPLESGPVRLRWWVYAVMVPVFLLVALLVVFAFKRNRRWVSEFYEKEKGEQYSPGHLDDKPSLPA